MVLNTIRREIIVHLNQKKKNAKENWAYKIKRNWSSVSDRGGGRGAKTTLWHQPRGEGLPLETLKTSIHKLHELAMPCVHTSPKLAMVSIQCIYSYVALVERIHHLLKPRLVRSRGQGAGWWVGRTHDPTTIMSTRKENGRWSCECIIKKWKFQ